MPGASKDDLTYRRLLRRFQELGARDPQGWARSEAEEGIAQLARLSFLSGIWRKAIGSWTTFDDWIEEQVEAATREEAPFADAGEALSRLLDAGARRDDLQRLARWVAYVTAFDIVQQLDEGYNPQLSEDYPGWRLIEVVGEEPTGRDLGGLHESLFETEPLGQKGRPSRQ